MVEVNGPKATSPVAVESMADQTLAFFDSVFNVVPQAYRQVDKNDLAFDERAARMNKAAKNGKKKAQMSLIEINERAAEKIQEIQRANALKSQQKIKQLAAEHLKSKANPVDPVDPDTIMDNNSEGEERKTERPTKGKSPRRNSKGKGGKAKGKNGSRTPLEKKEKVPSKNT